MQTPNNKMDIIHALKIVQAFSANSLTDRIANLEFVFNSKSAEGIIKRLKAENIDSTLVEAAFEVKRSAKQIDVIVHAVGILVSLPHILQTGEIVESLSLGAGNTGRKFDLITNLRVAEFKFIEWQGGSESIRQNTVFYDFFTLAEHDSSKKRCLYLLGTGEALKFLQGKRSLESIFSKNKKIRDQFYARYDKQFSVVSDYYKTKRHVVDILDLRSIIPSIWGPAFNNRLCGPPLFLN
jgi:hypothetical protein